MNSTRSEHSHKFAYEIRRATVSNHEPNSPEDMYVKTLTRYASQFVFQQIALVPRVQDFEGVIGKDGVYTVLSHEGRIEVTIESCICMFRRAMSLPCRHMISLRTTLGLGLFDIALCDKRWHLDRYKETQNFYHSTDNMESKINVSTTDESTKALTQHQKFRLASKEVFNLPTLISEVGNAEFRRRIELIKLLEKGWHEGQFMMISSVTEDPGNEVARRNIASTHQEEELQNFPECPNQLENSTHFHILPDDTVEDINNTPVNRQPKVRTFLLSIYVLCKP